MGTEFEGARTRGQGAAGSEALASGRPRQARRVMGRGWLRLRLRRRIALLLAGLSFAATLGLGVRAYLGAADAAVGRSQLQSLFGALLIGLVVTGLCTLAAVWASGPFTPHALSTLYANLDVACDSARQVEATLRAQLSRASHQSATARHLMDEIRTMTDVANALEQGVALLRDTTSQLYAGGAGAPVARSVAVASSQISGAAEQAMALCQRLRVFTNQVIAEANTLGEGSQQAVSRATALQDALRQVEAALAGAGTGSSGGLRAVSAVQGALARAATQQGSAILAPRASQPAQALTVPRASFRLAATPRRSSWQHTGRTVPRLGRSGRPPTHPHLQGGEGLGAPSSRPGSGGPRSAGNHPSTSRHIHRSWYANEQPDAWASGDQPAPPESASHSTPHPNPGEWLS